MAFLIFISGGIQADPTNSRLAGKDAFGYLGAFKMDYNTKYGDSQGRAASAVFELSADRESFYFGGRKKDTSIGEFDLPSLSPSTDYDALPVAAVVQQYSSIIGTDSVHSDYDGARLPTGNVEDLDRITGLLLRDDGSLVANAVKYYDGGADNTQTTLVIRDADNLATSEVLGFFSYEARAHMAGWISEIPTEWQTELGGKYISGWSSGFPVSSRNSIGPSAFVIDFDALGPSTPTTSVLPNTVLLDYGLHRKLNEDTYNNRLTERRDNTNQDTVPIIVGDNDLWTVVSWAAYGFILPGTRTYAVFGSSGGHNSGIGYKIKQFDQDSNCPGPCANDRFDYYNYYWLFDVNDLLAVKNGELQSHQVRPYEYGEFPVPFQTGGGVTSLTPSAIRPIRGGDFDKENNILYLVLGGSIQPEQVVVAFSVQVGECPKPPGRL